MRKELIFDLVYQIVSLESMEKLDQICSQIFKEAENHLSKAYELFEAGKKEEGKSEFYIGDTYLISLDQILGERLAPIMLNVNLKKKGVEDSLDFISKIDQGREAEINPELKNLVQFYKIIKNWKQKCWEPGEKVLEMKGKL